jgi:hypothetical protein
MNDNKKIPKELSNRPLDLSINFFCERIYLYGVFEKLLHDRFRALFSMIIIVVYQDVGNYHINISTTL